MKTKSLLCLRNFMVNRVTGNSVFILAIFPLMSMAQVPAVDANHTFAARFIEWPGFRPMPASVNEKNQWKNVSSGFFSQSFQIPLYYDNSFQNMTYVSGEPTWKDALVEAVREWNKVSNLIKLKTPQALNKEQNMEEFEWPPKPTIFVDENNSIYPEDGWELISFQLGLDKLGNPDPERIGQAYFILYNKYRSILRIFVAIEQDQY